MLRAAGSVALVFVSTGGCGCPSRWLKCTMHRNNAWVSQFTQEDYQAGKLGGVSPSYSLLGSGEHRLRPGTGRPSSSPAGSPVCCLSFSAYTPLCSSFPHGGRARDSARACEGGGNLHRTPFFSSRLVREGEVGEGPQSNWPSCISLFLSGCYRAQSLPRVRQFPQAGSYCSPSWPCR